MTINPIPSGPGASDSTADRGVAQGVVSWLPDHVFGQHSTVPLLALTGIAIMMGIWDIDRVLELGETHLADVKVVEGSPSVKRETLEKRGWHAEDDFVAAVPAAARFASPADVYVDIDSARYVRASLLGATDVDVFLTFGDGDVIRIPQRAAKGHLRQGPFDRFAHLLAHISASAMLFLCSAIFAGRWSVGERQRFVEGAGGAGRFARLQRAASMLKVPTAAFAALTVWAFALLSMTLIMSSRGAPRLAFLGPGELAPILMDVGLLALFCHVLQRAVRHVVEWPELRRVSEICAVTGRRVSQNATLDDVLPDSRIVLDRRAHDILSALRAIDDDIAAQLVGVGFRPGEANGPANELNLHRLELLLRVGFLRWGGDRLEVTTLGREHTGLYGAWTPFIPADVALALARNEQRLCGEDAAAGLAIIVSCATVMEEFLTRAIRTTLASLPEDCDKEPLRDAMHPSRKPTLDKLKTIFRDLCRMCATHQPRNGRMAGPELDKDSEQIQAIVSVCQAIRNRHVHARDRRQLDGVRASADAAEMLHLTRLAVGMVCRRLDVG